MTAFDQLGPVFLPVYTRDPNMDTREIEGLDVGIRLHVHVLRSAGIETVESCQGGNGHAFPDPTVRFVGEYGEGFRALSVVLQHGGMNVRALRRVWDVTPQHEPIGPLWELVFWVPAEAKASPVE